MREPYIRTASIIATIILVCLCIFQLLLILGVPLGHAVWGGKYEVLPLSLRVGSFVSIIIYIISIFMILSKSIIKNKYSDTRFVQIGLWVFVILFLLSALANLASKSLWERYLMTPLAIILGVGIFFVARYKEHNK